MTLYFIPKVFCAKCNKEADKVTRVHDPRSHQRYVKAFCHGQELRTQFVTEAGKTVTLWEPVVDKPD